MSSDLPNDMRRYYALRAREYERIYAKPERQADIAAVKAWLPPLFDGRQVLEVACGTGYWTPFAAATCTSWTATDVNEEVLTLARAKPLPHERVQFTLADAYALAVPRQFDAAFAGFWWSHVKKAQLAVFLKNLSLKLASGSVVAILDNTFTEWSSTPLSRRDAEGNTYQKRKLASGEEFDIMKNFPTHQELIELVAPVASEARIEEVTYYWLLVFKLK